MPHKNDTGAGFRAFGSYQGAKTNFETEASSSVSREVERVSGKVYGQERRQHELHHDPFVLFHLPW